MLRLLVLSISLAAVFVSSGVTANRRGDPTPEWSFAARDDSAASHFDFGNALGTQFKEKIVTRIEANPHMPTFLAALNTAKGKEIYDEFYAVHETEFPNFIEVTHRSTTPLCIFLSSRAELD